MDTVTIKPRFWPKREYTVGLANTPDGIPILIGDRINHPEIPQYYDSQDGSPYRGKRRITVTAAEVWNSEEKGNQIQVTAVLHDEDGLTGNGYTYSRCLCDEWVTRPEEVAPAIERALEAVQTADLTPEWTLICERYAARDTLLAGVSEKPSRVEYEAACVRLGCKAKSDQDAVHFAKWYSEYAGAYHRHSPRDMAAISLHIRYGRSIARQLEAQRREEEKRTMTLRHEPPKKEGQLWEPCPNCGKEPVYMPLHVCADCWDKGPRPEPVHAEEGGL
jgi:hypothetical protein